MGFIATGDALDWLRSLPDGCADMIFTDPPYGHTERGSLAQRVEAALGWRDGVNVYRPGSYSPLFQGDGKDAARLFRACLPEFDRVLAAPGCVCCCGGGGGPDPQFARWSLWLDEIFDFKQMVVWDKGPMGMGWHYRRSYEVVLVVQKRGGKCAWYDSSHRVENIIRPNMGIGKIIPRADQHPTEKPWKLAAFFIRLHTRPGDTVLDPFCGSGSTLEAAIRLGRNFLACDIDPDYVRMAERRVAKAAGRPIEMTDDEAARAMPLFEGLLKERNR